ncbi:hypothetical protein GQ651_11995 [Alphaproteobacteria bacterium GH1-50]|uniref:Phosphodiester glycosidase domain-containing protein n=1 Tax=Kangsaoukella pontilimi TaxID=2691042 RepID=A0A7C9IH98_9RHOB|nr:phosphodiester glycosidase family protein [Kangsaoukella pontilimi]MXQ08569.1 hypothetical protein [Kangsaoukella pontilimi]
MKTSAAIWTAISLAISVASAAAGDPAPLCESIQFDDLPFTICTADPATDDIRLFLRDENGATLGTFGKVQDSLPEGQTLTFAMNGGMYHPDRRPVGLYIQGGEEIARIVTREGPGNFGLLPNGVLCLNDDSAQVIESRAFDTERPACRDATQSGPMLVIDGALHPRFLKESDSRHYRNGVGVTPDGRLVAAISDVPVTFHEFGRLFRDRLRTPNALFLDGRVSRLYAPALDRHDFGFPMGPILGVVTSGD